MPHYAAIDLGTNSCRLLIAEPVGDDLRVVHERVEVVGLGRGVDREGRLREEVASAVIELLAEFARDCARLQVTEVAAVATSALRDAGDRREFVDRVALEAGITLEVISGEKEARLSFLAAIRSAGGPDAGEIVVVDFGGGSTELIYGRGVEIERAISVDVGSRRMLERFLRTDPPTAREWREMMAFLRDTLQELPAAAPNAPLIGIGATTIHLSRMIHGDNGLLPFTSGDLAPVSERIRTTPMNRRRDFVGLDPRRADVIVAGCGLVTAVLGKFQRPIAPSPWGLRHGLFIDRFGQR